MLGEEPSSRGNSKGKGPEAEPCLACLRTCKEASVAAAVEGQGGEWEETGQSGGQAVPGLMGITGLQLQLSETEHLGCRVRS